MQSHFLGQIKTTAWNKYLDVLGFPFQQATVLFFNEPLKRTNISAIVEIVLISPSKVPPKKATHVSVNTTRAKSSDGNVEVWADLWVNANIRFSHRRSLFPIFNQQQSVICLDMTAPLLCYDNSMGYLVATGTKASQGAQRGRKTGFKEKKCQDYSHQVDWNMTQNEL